MILSKKTKHGLLSMGLAFGILTHPSFRLHLFLFLPATILPEMCSLMLISGHRSRIGIRREHNLCRCPKRGTAASEQQKSI